MTARSDYTATPADVLSTIGMTMSDLGPPKASRNGKSLRTIVATYDYRDADGTLLGQVVRKEPGRDGNKKDFLQRRPKPDGEWEWKKSVKQVPYRLPELLAADPAELVVVVEGEKDADRLAALGVVATCNAGGAGKWAAAYSEHLRGRHVAILPDNDVPGRNHAQQVATSLAGVAASVKIVELPGLPENGDITDWLDAGGTTTQLLQILDDTPAQSTASPRNQPPAGGALREALAAAIGDDSLREWYQLEATFYCSDPARWSLRHPQFHKAKNGELEFTCTREFGNKNILQDRAREIQCAIPGGLLKKWNAVCDVLAVHARIVKVDIDERHDVSIASAILHYLEAAEIANPIDEGKQLPRSNGKPTRMPDGAVWFQTNTLVSYLAMQYVQLKVEYGEVVRCLNEVAGSLRKNKRSDGRVRTYKVVTPEGLQAIRAFVGATRVDDAQ